MKALTWQSKSTVDVKDVPDPVIEAPTDAIVRVTSTAICGSDLHLYTALAPYLAAGDILGHEFMGIVEEVGGDTGDLRVGDRVVVPFNISCGHCWMCEHGLQSQCETTQVREQDSGAALFGYTSLYGSVPGGQAQYARVPQAQYGPIRVPQSGPDERYLYLSDILPTAWQGARYAEIEDGDTVVVVGLGPVGQLATRCAKAQGAGRVIGLDLVADRLATAAEHGVETIDITQVDDIEAAIKDRTQGRGADAVIEAVGMEAHGSPVFSVAIDIASSLPKPLARKATETFGVDRLAALETAFAVARRGGTVSISGVYGGAANPINMMQLFDKQLRLHMGQANVKRWIDELMPYVEDESDPFGLTTLATHHVPLTQAPAAYEMFQKKEDHCLKVVLDPTR